MYCALENTADAGEGPHHAASCREACGMLLTRMRCCNDNLILGCLREMRRRGTTYFPRPGHRQVRWRLLDAEGQVLGRLAVRAARVLTGKTSADYSPHVDGRDGVIIINAEKICLTGRKLDRKIYRHYTGYPGGLREVSARRLLATQPERLVREAILGMLPKTRLGARMAGRLRIYSGPEHPHVAQAPEALPAAH